jgi:hypothetical protein
MKWLGLVAVLTVFGIVAYNPRTADESEQSVYEVDIKTDDGSKIVVSKGSQISYDITYAVAPGAWISELKASVDGSLGSPKYQGVSHWSNGHPRVGGGHKRIVFTAVREGTSTVTISYKEGRNTEPTKKVFKVEVK